MKSNILPILLATVIVINFSTEYCFAAPTPADAATGEPSASYSDTQKATEILAKIRSSLDDLDERTAFIDSKRWKLYSMGPTTGYWFYDSKTLRKKGNKASVWSMAYPAKGHSAFLKDTFYQHERIDRSIFVTEFRCLDGKFIQPSHTAYDIDGNQLASHSVADKNYQWHYIAPESTMDILFQIACNSKGNGKKTSKQK
jgi:hypothetical protein